MQHMSGVEEVKMRKSKNILFMVKKPDVFVSPVSNTYIVFGEAKVPIKLRSNGCKQY